MKTKTAVSVMLGLASVGIIAFVSCQKDAVSPSAVLAEAGSERIPQSSVPIDSVPSYHRQGLDYIAAHCDFRGLRPEEVLEASARAVGDFLTVQCGYPAKEILPVVDSCIPKLVEVQAMFTTSGFMDPATFAGYMEQLRQATGISKSLRDLLVDFYTLSVDPGVDVETMDQFVATQLDPKGFTGADQDALEVFNGIWDDSKDYWSPPIGLKHKGCPYWEYANDAIGGLFGLALGPGGSIILGAAASAYTHWECN
jgi:hypothetical protein